MRPSNPGVPYSGHPTHPQYSINTTQAQFFTSRGAQIPKGQNLKYYPSLSGSETDVSTSTENLTQEERYVLRNMERQEPQGEENHQPVPHYGQTYQSYMGGPSYHPPPPYNDRLVAQQLASNNARREALRLDAMIQASRQGTPVGTPGPALHRMTAEDLYSVRMSAASRLAHQTNTPPIQAYHQAIASNVAMTQEHSLSRLAPSVYSHPNVQDPILKSPKSFYQDPQVIMPKRGFNISSSGAYFDTSAISAKQTSDLQTQNDIIAQLTREMKMNGGLSGGSDVESSGSTSTLNNPAATAEKIAALALQAKLNTTIPNGNNTNNTQGMNMKTSASSQSMDQSKLLESQTKPPPPYNGNNYIQPELKEEGKVKQAEMRKSSIGKPDNLPLLSCSQPDIPSHPVNPGNGNNNQQNSNNLGSPDAPQYTQEMIDIITNENRELKHQLDMHKRKIMKLDNLEKEMMKIHEAYQALKEHSEKRELLEKNARGKLQGEIVNLGDVNKEFKERHDAIMAQMMSGDTSNIPGLDSILRGEIMRKDALINQLVNQNKEMLSTKERQDIELSAQRETLQEQRTHIDVLDSALSNAQSNVLRLEEEVRQKEVYVVRVKEMTKSLEQLQAASEKREAMEKKLRAKLEDELKDFRQEKESGTNNRNDGDIDIEQVTRKLSACEEKIIRLESERTQWEQRYLEESAMRQVAIDAASIPKDAKIAVLEKTSAESEKKIAEARSDKLKQISEMQQTQRKMSDMELKLKALETSLAERNAMIKVLQKRAFEKSSEAENVLSIPIQDSLPASNSLILHSKQLSQSHIGSPTQIGSPSHGPLSHLGISVCHASQLSTPIPLSISGTNSTRHSAAVSDFFDGISTTSLSSASRGPLGKLSVHNRVRSGSPAHIQRSATPNDMLRSVTPTRDLINSSKSIRRDSAPGGAFSYSESLAGKTLINTSDLYTTNSMIHSGGTLPKMSFAPMKEELSRTLPTKGFTSLADSYHERFPEGNSSMRLSESNGPPQSSRNPPSSGNTTSTTTVSKNISDMERKSSERPNTRDRRDRVDQSNMSLDSSLTMMDDTVNSSILNRSSLLEALKHEKESRPESYWRV
eukprot:TRINITY_DN3598_c0_g1_i1.p1 TRINITY_DN3598_c0_g1~~TRINITY_DN3598_c0_g1_i1.p1  ORF type:complete len:1094 (-),score=184.02 TRINITY_DN3598_c0_g1_i1:874-4155(-)